MKTTTIKKQDSSHQTFVDYCMVVACLDVIIEDKSKSLFIQKYDSDLIDFTREKYQGLTERVIKHLPKFARGYILGLKRKIIQSGLDINTFYYRTEPILEVEA